jgi:hypothetical protein
VIFVKKKLVEPPGPGFIKATTFDRFDPVFHRFSSKSMDLLGSGLCLATGFFPCVYALPRTTLPDFGSGSTAGRAIVPSGSIEFE